MADQTSAGNGRRSASPERADLTFDVVAAAAAAGSEAEAAVPPPPPPPPPHPAAAAAAEDGLGRLFDDCVARVSRLEERRDEQVAELRRLREPLLRAAGRLRAELADARLLLALAQRDHAAVREQVQRLKRKLFAAAGDCVRARVTLAAREYEVAQSRVTQEELETHIQSLTEELSQLQEAHQDQLSSLRDRAAWPRRPRAASDVGQCRHASLRLQRRLSGSMRALEGWYEPRLVALLRRRQLGEDALRKSRGQAEDLRARLGPLGEDIQRLRVQRACLEQRIDLMDRAREESSNQHKETVEELRETLRELQLEFKIQKRSKKDLEELKDGLLKELVFLRGCDGPSESTAKEDP